MPRALAFSISGFCLALVAFVGLAAYTTTDLPDEELGAISATGIASPLTHEKLRPEPGSGTCAAYFSGGGWPRQIAHARRAQSPVA